MSNATANQAKKAAVFKAMHDSSDIFVIPNPWDAGSARMMGNAGFKALATTSAGYAFSIGLGDGGITLEQKLAHSTRVDDLSNGGRYINFSLEAFSIKRYLCTSVPSVIRFRAAEAQ